MIRRVVYASALGAVVPSCAPDMRQAGSGCRMPLLLAAALAQPAIAERIRPTPRKRRVLTSLMELRIQTAWHGYSIATPVGKRRLPGGASQEARRGPLRREQRNRLPVEGHEGFSAKPLPFVDNDVISKIATCFEHRQARFHGWPVRLHACRSQQGVNCGGDIGRLEAIDPAQHPRELAQTRQRDGDQLTIGCEPG